MTLPGGVTDRDVQALLDELREASGVVGASLALSFDGRVCEFASGRTSIASDAHVRTDTPFLVGSTSKSFTATLIAQLVDEGRISFDDPVAGHLPDVRPIAADVTVGQLLAHTSGLDNGPYADHGCDGDAVGRYVASLSDLPVAHPPGERFGYSNAGYVIAGRLIEVLTAMTWDRALADRLLGPAGLVSSFMWSGREIPANAARGHRRQDDGSVVVAPLFSVAGRSMGPTGSTLLCTAGDLVRFGALHADGDDGVFGAGVGAEMRAVVSLLPEGSTIAHAWTKGFLVERYGETLVYGHTGHTMGAGSYLRFLPDERFAMALLFNSPGDATLFHELSRALFDRCFGLRRPDPWVTVERDLDIDLSSYCGTYRIMGAPTEVVAEDGGLRLVGGPDIAARTGLGDVMRPATPAVFGTRKDGQYSVAPPPGALVPDLIFDDFVDGRPRFALGTVFLFPRLD